MWASPQNRQPQIAHMRIPTWYGMHTILVVMRIMQILQLSFLFHFSVLLPL